MVKGQNYEEVELGRKKEYKKKQILSLSFLGTVCMICAAWSRPVNLLLTNTHLRPASVIRMNFSIEVDNPNKTDRTTTGKSS